MAGFEMGAGGRGHKICDLSLELQRPLWQPHRGGWTGSGEAQPDGELGGLQLHAEAACPAPEPP